MSAKRASTVQLAAAFTTVYLVWGSTYLAMQYATRTMPPLVMLSFRNLIGGSVLYGWAWLNGAPKQSRSTWMSAFIAGFLMLTCGNGSVATAVQWVPSGLTAVMIAAVPMWIVILNWIRPGGSRPVPRAVIGVVLGLAGVATLVGIGSIHAKGAIDRAGAGVLVFAAIAWAAGSVYSSRVVFSQSPIQSSGMQMLGGGAGLLAASTLSGQVGRFHPSHVSTQSWLALIYLTIAGSIAAFTAYSWLLKATTPAQAATYAYVNPVVAVFLGWAIAGEPLTARALAAMTMIVLAVIVITTARPRVRELPNDAEAPKRSFIYSQ